MQIKSLTIELDTNLEFKDEVHTVFSEWVDIVENQGDDNIDSITLMTGYCILQNINTVRSDIKSCGKISIFSKLKIDPETPPPPSIFSLIFPKSREPRAWRFLSLVLIFPKLALFTHPPSIFSLLKITNLP